MKARRFYFVSSARGRVAHMAFRITHGYRTHCGIVMGPGWKWARTALAKKGAKANVCSKCLAAVR